MAPTFTTHSLSGEHVRQVSRSIASSLSSVPPGLHERHIPESVHASILKNIPFIPRTIHHISNILPGASAAVSSSIHLPKRQTQVITLIPAQYDGLNDGPAPGAVVGIVLGSVGGFLLILWLIYSCFGLGRFGGGGGEVVEEEVVRRRSRSPRRSRMRTETVEISTSRSPPRRERVVVEETRRVSRPPEPDPPEIIDDIVEVIEEHSASASTSPPPSRKPSKRPPGGYRTVDPAELGGGRRPMRNVR